MAEGMDPNAPVLKPGKRKKKKEKLDARGRLIPTSTKKKALTKKQRKRKEKAIERKAKLEKRSEVLEELQKYALPLEQTQQLTSFANMKRKAPPISAPEDGVRKLNSIKGGRRRAARASVADTGPYYETGSSSEEEENKEEVQEEDPTQDEPQPSTSKEPDEPEVQDLDESTAPVDQAGPAAKPSPRSKRPVNTHEERKAAVHVRVERTAEVQAARLKLPILAEEQEIVETINEHPVTLICGETGSGKTTQVPQFLYEAGYTSGGKMMGVTEPRRVAAVSMATRIAHEMSLSSDVVSYQIRYEGNAGDDTKIKTRKRLELMTDGVLMKEIQRDIRLTRYSVIIIDEAHERRQFNRSDILLGLLSRIVVMREKQGDPLKLIVMSATLRVEDFTSPRLFPNTPPVIKVESRQFPVTTHFLRRTPEEYLGAAFRKVSLIHRTLPPGAVLVFVSGQREVATLIRWLTTAFPLHQGDEETTLPRKRRKKAKKVTDLPAVDLDAYSTKHIDLDADDAGDELELLDDEEEAGDIGEVVGGDPLFCLPLYSLLPSAEQQRVFQDVPGGHRLCVVATNVAETSLTIPGVRYVVDSGKEKVRRYDPVTGVSEFVVQWVSQASAEQRTGRAGRVGPGHAYRLYSSAVFADFLPHPPSDILNKPVDDLVLQMKSMNIVKVPNFPFPTPPESDALAAAEERLLKIGALASSPKDGLRRVTALGRTIALFPLKPQYGKILALSEQSALLPYSVCLVAALSVREPLINLAALEKEAILANVRLRRRWAGGGQTRLLGDLAVLLKAVGSSEFAGLTPAFATAHGLRYKAMVEIRKLRRQLTNLINANCALSQPLGLDPKMGPPSDRQALLLSQLFLSGLPANVAKRQYTDLHGKPLKAAYRTMTMEETVYLNPASVMYKDEPEYVVYQEVVRTDEKTVIQCISAVDADWLPLFATSYCVFEPLSDASPPVYDAQSDQVRVEMRAFYGAGRWELGRVLREAPLDLDRYRWFAKFLLDGAVFPEFAHWRPKLLASPATLLKSWAHLQERNEALLGALVEGEVWSRRVLGERWGREPTFLLPQFKLWLPSSLHPKAEALWPFIPSDSDQSL